MVGLNYSAIDYRERAFPGTVAVSGAAGRFGNLVIRRLHRTDDVLAIDPRDFNRRPADVEHLNGELRRKDIHDVFRRGRVDAVIHLGAYHMEYSTGHVTDRFTTAVENFSRLLDYCDKYNVRKLVLLSSADVYGARARNPQFLTEEAPLLATDLSALRDIDMMAQSFFWKRPDIETVILRPTHVTGGMNNVISKYLRLTPVPTLLGYDPMMQFVHEEDVIQAIRLALGQGHRGIFNIAGPSPIALSRVIKRLDRQTIPVPHTLAKPLLGQLHRMGHVDIRATYVDFIRYVCMVDDSRSRKDLGYKPNFDLDETLAAVDLWY